MVVVNRHHQQRIDAGQKEPARQRRLLRQVLRLQNRQVQTARNLPISHLAFSLSPSHTLARRVSPSLSGLLDCCQRESNGPVLKRLHVNRETCYISRAQWKDNPYKFACPPDLPQSRSPQAAKSQSLGRATGAGGGGQSPHCCTAVLKQSLVREKRCKPSVTHCAHSCPPHSLRVKERPKKMENEKDRQREVLVHPLIGRTSADSERTSQGIA